MKKILTIYYSRKGENYWGGKLVDLKKGNTERVAEFIQKAVGGDLFQVDTVIPFCTNEGSGMGQSEADLRKLCKGATVKPGLAIRCCKAELAEAQVAAWAKQSI